MGEKRKRKCLWLSELHTGSVLSAVQSNHAACDTVNNMTFFFASAEKKLEMAALHTNMRIRSLPFAHLFYAAPCSITIFIIIKQGLFFL